MALHGNRNLPDEPTSSSPSRVPRQDDDEPVSCLWRRREPCVSCWSDVRFFLGNKAGVTSLIAPGNGVLKR